MGDEEQGGQGLVVGAGKDDPHDRPLIKARRATPLPAALHPAPGEALFEAPAGRSAPVDLESPRSTRERSRGRSIRRTSIEFSPQDGDETVAPKDFLKQESVRV